MQAHLKHAGAILVGGLLAAGSAAAQQAPAADATPPTETTATYQDWLMRCIAPADQVRACEVVQNLQIEGQGPVASIAVGRTGPDKPLLIVIQVPQGVWLPGGMTLKVGEKGQPLPLEYKRCAQACVAEATLDAEAVKAMKATTETGSFTFKDGAQRDVTLPVSFRGFSAALDASLAP